MLPPMYVQYLGSFFFFISALEAASVKNPTSLQLLKALEPCASLHLVALCKVAFRNLGGFRSSPQQSHESFRTVLPSLCASVNYSHTAS